MSTKLTLSAMLSVISVRRVLGHSQIAAPLVLSFPSPPPHIYLRPVALRNLHYSPTLSTDVREKSLPQDDICVHPTSSASLSLLARLRTHPFVIAIGKKAERHEKGVKFALSVMTWASMLGCMALWGGYYIM